ncbi:hypothetical protein [Micromonospora aurantiaca (nom. illeg.)]|uniref:hypothetical protein n=1 Tax=Micromonospora aurantiaca (nom. illeg.) TaxID=47850 RepID=UPI0033EC35BA
MLVYAPGVTAGDSDGDGWAVMSAGDAERGGHMVTATRDALIAAFGRPSWTDDEAHAIARRINEGRCPRCFTDPTTRAGFCAACAAAVRRGPR